MSKPEITYTENKTKGDILDIACIECKRETEHAVATSYDVDGSVVNRQEGWSVDWASHYQVIQCKGCKTITFREAKWNSEAEAQWAGDDGTMEVLYPKRQLGALTAKNAFNVPVAVRRIYREVIDCFNNESFTLCAAGLRATVEGICADQGITSGPVEAPKKGGGTHIVQRKDLEGKIASLAVKGLLTEANAKILHAHRFLGNEAIHQLSTPSPEELRLAIDIVEHTMVQLYELPHTAKHLDRTTQSRKKRTKP